MGSSRLTRRFYSVGPEAFARRLLGCVLVRVLDSGERLSGRIVETEAYLGEHDKAAHSFGMRRTSRNESMYGPPGTAYVYFTYGMHYCFNAVCGSEGEPVAALIRALEPLEGVETMRLHRGGEARAATLRETEITSGPARLCKALDMDRRLDGLDLVTDERLWIERGRAVAEARVATSPRVGIGYAGDWVEKPLRFYVLDNPHVSGPRARAKPRTLKR